MGRLCGYRCCQAVWARVSPRSAAMIPDQTKTYRHDSRDAERALFECRGSSFDARRKRANRAELEAASACRPHALLPPAETPACENVEPGIDRTAICLPLPSRGLAGCQSRFAPTNRTIGSAPGELGSVVCAAGGEHLPRARVAHHGERRRKRYDGKRQNLVGRHPLCGKKVLPAHH